MLQPNPMQSSPEQGAPIQAIPETPRVTELQPTPEQFDVAPEIPVVENQGGVSVEQLAEVAAPAAGETGDKVTPLVDQMELDEEYVDRVEKIEDKFKDDKKVAEFQDEFSEAGQHYLDEKFGKEIQKSED